MDGALYKLLPLIKWRRERDSNLPFKPNVNVDASRRVSCISANTFDEVGYNDFTYDSWLTRNASSKTACNPRIERLFLIPQVQSVPVMVPDHERSKLLMQTKCRSRGDPPEKRAYAKHAFAECSQKGFPHFVFQTFR